MTQAAGRETVYQPLPEGMLAPAYTRGIDLRRSKNGEAVYHDMLKYSGGMMDTLINRTLPRTQDRDNLPPTTQLVRAIFMGLWKKAWKFYNNNRERIIPQDGFGPFRIIYIHRMIIRGVNDQNYHYRQFVEENPDEEEEVEEEEFDLTNIPVYGRQMVIEGIDQLETQED